ncbi:hypothetical protein CALCODRAFT_198492 [Calocera cornea HHB12733]|uniref:Uncharacterized protein n=1 Tax=Calocera cornea HHB12733 TaxID=1353952 RepID=A0A165HFK2_9BASI|nr:hypothetical protein CALCODRAFT_198492 [Calocera cornea HHB12733]
MPRRSADRGSLGGKEGSGRRRGGPLQERGGSVARGMGSQERVVRFPPSGLVFRRPRARSDLDLDLDLGLGPALSRWSAHFRQTPVPSQTHCTPYCNNTPPAPSRQQRLGQRRALPAPRAPRRPPYGSLPPPGPFHLISQMRTRHDIIHCSPGAARVASPAHGHDSPVSIHRPASPIWSAPSSSCGWAKARSPCFCPKRASAEPEPGKPARAGHDSYCLNDCTRHYGDMTTTHVVHDRRDIHDMCTRAGGP